jgi:hypothetical protein
MIHLFNQINKEIFIEGDESLVKVLRPEFKKWGIKAVKNFSDKNDKKKIVLEPLFDTGSSHINLDNVNRYHVFCVTGGLKEPSHTIDISLNGSKSKMIPELCRILHHVCE